MLAKQEAEKNGGGINKYKFGRHLCTGDYGFIYLDEPIQKGETNE